MRRFRSFAKSIKVIIRFVIAILCLLQTSEVLTAQVNPHVAISMENKINFKNTPYGDLLARLEGLEPEYQALILYSIDNEGHKNIPDDKYDGALSALFEKATQAHYKYRNTYSANNFVNGLDEKITALMQIHNLELDTLDIQSKVAGMLRARHPQFAMQKYASIQLPRTNITCADAAVPRYSLYYDVLRGFYLDDRIKQVNGEQKSVYLMQIARNSTTMEKITPFIGIMVDLNLPSDVQQMIDVQLIAQLKSISASDREMNALTLPLIANINKYVNQDNQSRLKFLAALRQMLVSNLQAGYCSDVAAPREKIMDAFNKMIPEASEIAPMKLADLSSQNAQGTAQEEMMPEFQEARNYWKDLINQTQQRDSEGNFHNGNPDPEAVSNDVNQVIQVMHQMSTRNNCEICVFEKSAGLYLEMINRLPKGAQLEYAIQEFITMLEQNPVEHDNPAIYAANLDWLMKLSRPRSKQADEMTKEYEKKGVYASVFNQSLDKEYIRTRISQSEDPIIQVYYLYEQLYKPEFIIH